MTFSKASHWGCSFVQQKVKSLVFVAFWPQCGKTLPLLYFMLCAPSHSEQLWLKSYFTTTSGVMSLYTTVVEKCTLRSIQFVLLLTKYDQFCNIYKKINNFVFTLTQFIWFKWGSCNSSPQIKVPKLNNSTQIGVPQIGVHKSGSHKSGSHKSGSHKSGSTSNSWL
jgi:hypothetical protein